MICVLDAETTGLDPIDNAVWELAAVAVHKGQLVAEWSSLLRLPQQCREERHFDVMRRISGVSEEMIEMVCEYAPNPIRTSDSLQCWLRNTCADHTGALTSFNVMFDQRFLTWLEPLFFHYPARVTGWSPCLMVTAHERMSAANALPLDVNGKPKRPNLREACAFFEVPFVETHRARPDAYAAAQLAIKMDVEGAV